MNHVSEPDRYARRMVHRATESEAGFTVDLDGQLFLVGRRRIDGGRWSYWRLRVSDELVDHLVARNDALREVDQVVLGTGPVEEVQT